MLHLQNTRFIGELTKFRVTPTHTVFHCFKVCLDDFTGANVDNLATLLETCGRFLLRTDETGDRMRSMVSVATGLASVQLRKSRELKLILLMLVDSAGNAQAQKSSSESRPSAAVDAGQCLLPSE